MRQEVLNEFLDLASDEVLRKDLGIGTQAVRLNFLEGLMMAYYLLAQEHIGAPDITKLIGMHLMARKYKRVVGFIAQGEFVESSEFISRN